jgi:hypothetical protein
LMMRRLLTLAPAGREDVVEAEAISKRPIALAAAGYRPPADQQQQLNAPLPCPANSIDGRRWSG